MTSLISTAAFVCFVTGMLYFGKRKKGYSHLRHTISELGERATVDAAKVNYGFFLPLGVALATLAFSAGNSTLQGLAACLATGYIVSAIFPCDPGSPLNGSWQQQLHNLGGFIQYAGGTYFLFQASEHNQFFLGAAILLILCTLGLSIPGLPLRGFFQRMAEFLLFGSLLTLA